MSTFAPALAGVVVGALLTWLLGTMRDRAQRDHATREARRLENLDLISEFLADVAAVRSGRDLVARSIVEIIAHRDDPAPRASRLEGFEEARLPRRRAEIAVERMRLVVPTLAQPGADLLSAADRYTIDTHDADEKRRAEANEHFLAAALPLVN